MFHIRINISCKKCKIASSHSDFFLILRQYMCKQIMENAPAQVLTQLYHCVNSPIREKIK